MVIVKSPSISNNFFKQIKTDSSPTTIFGLMFYDNKYLTINIASSVFTTS